MAKASGTIQEPLTKQDRAYAKMLLEYSRTLPKHRMKLEAYEERYWGRGRG
jgi:hypothetical protein